MKIGVEIDHKEFLALREKLQQGHVGLDEREILQVRFGKMVLENIITEKMTPSWHCENCKSDFSTVGDMVSCPKCFTQSLVYVGPPRIGHEIPLKPVKRLREATRSDMEQGTYYRASVEGVSIDEKRKRQYEYQKKRNDAQRKYFRKCPPDHQLTFKGMKEDYGVYYCNTCKDYKMRKDLLNV